MFDYALFICCNFITNRLTRGIKQGIIGSVLRDEKAAGYMDEPRILAICELAQERVNRLKDFVKEKIDG